MTTFRYFIFATHYRYIGVLIAYSYVRLLTDLKRLKTCVFSISLIAGKDGQI